MKYLIGIDEGTTSCKTAIFDEKGNMIVSAGREYPCYYPKPGYVEQNILEIKKNVFASCKEAIEKSNINPNDIAGVGYSNQGITMVLLDEKGNLVRENTIGWQDVRHVGISEEIKKGIDNKKYYNTAGVSFGTYNTPCLLWLQKNEPNIWKRVKRICGHQDWFLKQLGADDYYIDCGNAAFWGFMNIAKDDWDDDILKIYGIDRSMLPRITLEVGKVTGRVSKEVSDETGLPVGCPICLGALDTNASCFAAGAIHVGTAVMVVGTAGTFTKISDKPNPDPCMIITNRRNPGSEYWQMYAMTNTAASSFRWFRDALCSLEVAASKLLDRDPYDLMTEIANTSVPGSNGVTALTCFQGAHVHHNNENMRGTFFGIGLGTKKSDIAHAILEGICFEMKAIMQMSEKISDKVTEVRLCGGAANSKLWCQMFADILNVPVNIMKTKEMGSLGAAMFAGIGSKIFINSEDAVKQCAIISDTYFPNQHSANIYANSYDLWLKAYDSVISSFYA